ncbi:UNVERIFIED_CONTAM: 2-alkenal reductase (NADP(+)-dependent) [Sesamum calycinum]|uniref:2-alkenal reductase (NADP(+)-dependent) n=1 Tax=Sesamum calycinum TaxID=2727403 RepID=A0AAW2SYZ7_9LAMI
MKKMELPNKQIILKNYVQGCPKESDLELKMGVASTEIPEGSRGVFVKNIYLACDPYMCHLMRPQRKSLFILSSIVPGTVIKGCGVAKVIKSAYPELKEGDYVWGLIGWEEFSLVLNPEMILHKIQNKDFPLSYYTGILGMPGLAAYAGFHEICCPKQGEVVYVSSAAGGVGHLVGQFAKLMGCYVVGSASTQQKVDLLKTKLGFDDAFNYKEGHDLGAQLKKHFPKGIDIYFDNVGGEMLDEVLLHMNIHGRVAVSGMISQYNLSKPQGIHNLFSLIENRVTMRGFVERDYVHMHPQYGEWAAQKLQEKKLIYLQDVAIGLENAASAFVGIYHGRSIGKQIIRVSDD